MTDAHIRDISERDFVRVLTINDESVKVLSPLSLDSLRALHGETVYCRGVSVADQIVAFVLAFSEGAHYASMNYRWFADRYARFLYVDRIVVDRRYRRNGLGRSLYTDLFRFAHGSAAERITCEIDVDPPNEASRRFHARYGFRTVGTHRLVGGRLVAMQELGLPILSAG
ncbi:GNAT family N-acetyltransferase [Sphingomonas sp. NCPPB 2930]